MTSFLREGAPFK